MPTLDAGILCAKADLRRENEVDSREMEARDLESDVRVFDPRENKPES